MSYKVLWQEMFPDEFVEIRNRFPVCWMAYGLAEPHGPYNALGLDWLKAQALVERAAKTHGGIVAPPMCWHIQEMPEFHDNGAGVGWLCDNGVKEPLASSIPADLFYRMVFHQIRDFDARGFHAAVLVTGHYGGLEKTLRCICEYYARRTGSPIRLNAIADWECMDPGIPHAKGDHAGVTETSQLMVLCPGLTDLERTKAPQEIGERFAGKDFEKERVIPSIEIGEPIVESQITGLGEIAKRLLDEYSPVSGWKAPNSREVDGIWHRFDLATRRYWSVSYDEYKSGGRLAFPDWATLGE